MTNTTLKVEGMSCGHCVKAVEGSLGKLNGVEGVKVDLDTGSVDVQFNPDVISLDEIKETIDDQGYDVH